ncbi:MAG: deoxyguanosinetriphosphate triphosphohydrolase [Deltaproteobacteria bacterium]|nr:deoxyguanosinetriphosphate triphosphohydrolase [Deltaproteobacteria bacterium]
MLTREQFERHEVTLLAPYAARACESRGRQIATPEDPYRTIFQRDRDRIIHSSAFRRLEYKTQVFVNHEGDYYRTRLTHSLEVAQISRAICRSLQLNEDLAETIALSHDLGHTPFGHAGEEAMHALMADCNGFEHNHQSYRVVTLLEQRYPDYTGLNLSFEVLEGIVKHAGEYDAPRGIPDFDYQGYPSLESQIVNLADEIAYTNHDLDDGLQSGMLTYDLLDHVSLWQTCYEDVGREFPTAIPKVIRHQVVRRLIKQCIEDMLRETERRLNAHAIQTVADVRERGDQIAAFSAPFSAELTALKQFLFEHLYRHYRVVRMAEKAKRTIEDLFYAFQNNARMLPREFYERIVADQQKERHICDYIAGMTDRFAFDEHRRLFDPHAKV